jgi:predicted CXXCH cytochrome family protein
MKAASFLVAIGIASAAMAASVGSVKGSKHDLSKSGPGPIKAESESQSCVFCHIPHGGAPKTALSGRPEIGNTHRAYESTTLRGRASTPSGTTRICLSCHDGTIAVGQTRKGSIKMQGVAPDGRIPGTRHSNLGTDLRATHPVSMTTAAGAKAHGPMDRRVRLDSGGQVQCTSCHDPHAEYAGSTEGKFLVAATKASELCVTCHDRGTGGHATSAQPFAVSQGNEAGYGSVAEAGCRACHRSHGADVTGRLLSRSSTDAEDAMCLRCHASTTLTLDVSRQYSKPSSHSLFGGGGRVHDASEGPSATGHRLPEQSPGQSRHAACVDCHDPHQAEVAPARAPFAAGGIKGTWGIDLTGRRVEPIRFEYELCFKCHGDSANKPTPRASQPRRRMTDQNLRQVFSSGAVSYHPVTTPSRGGNVPGLLPAYPPGSLIYCTDCHASDDGPGVGGKGARGPHGSMYAPLLERNYTTGAFSGESAFAYALCYKCHDRDVLLSSRSNFRTHRRHVVDMQTTCSTCHNPHGISAMSGSQAQNAHLIDFDIAVVSPGRGGVLRYDSGARNCTLTCHGAAHDNRPY